MMEIERIRVRGDEKELVVAKIEDVSVQPLIWHYQ